MNKDILIVYHSETGFTEKYARWLSEDLDCLAISLDSAKKQNLKEYKKILFGSWMMAGEVHRLKEIQEICPDEDNCVLFVTGAAPANFTDNFTAIHTALQSLDFDIKYFYLQSGLNYQKMKFRNRMVMRMMSIMLKIRKPVGENEIMLKSILKNSFDNSRREYLVPMENYVLTGSEEQK